MKKYQLILILGILIIGFILRFFELSSFPAALHRDEAFLGYNAYSILKTGRDITGDFLPLHFKSFLYSPGGYSYFSIPFIALFGLSEFSVRAASAFFGVLSIGVLYFLSMELLRRRKEAFFVSILSAGILAFFPWHINLSRTATENVVVVFFTLLGTYLFLLWSRNEKKIFFLASFVCFFITLFLYQAPRSFLPFYIPFIALLFTKKTRKNIFLVLGVYTVVIIVPIVSILLSPQLALRINTVSVFSSEETQLVINEQITQEAVQDVNPYISRSFHNKIIGYGNNFLQNYFGHLSYEFFFTELPFPDRYRVPLTGIAPVIFLPFLLMGLYFLTRRYQRIGLFIIGTTFFVPIGSALAYDDIPNVQRTLLMAPFLSLIVAFGIYSLYVVKIQRKVRVVLGGVAMIIFIFSTIYYLRQYYIHQPVYRPWYRNDGYRELVQSINNRIGNYEKSIITTRESAPTIFFLFYSQYDPKSFQNQTRHLTTHDFDRVPFAQYEFSTEECPLGEKVIDGKKVLIGEKGVLYVNSSLCNTINGIEILEVIKRRDGSEVFYITTRK